jgi:UDP-N-acetylmuramoyl-L-alanyl-D-glutamate--2,6-diaminopimelate ligase
MLLHQLVRELDPHFDLNGIADARVQGICEDSRLVRPGELFIARAGTRLDGAKFIQDAKARGAIAVICAAHLADCPLPQIIVADPAAAASRLAHIFYGHPSRHLRVLAVTGTNGKTTTAYLIRHLLSKAGHRCGLIGTIETDDGRMRREAALTTPDSVEVARLMAAMRDNGCRACAIETSSHALHQKRVSGVNFAGAAFTNLSGDHLDYHGTMENYAGAKASLFESLGPQAIAVVNAEDRWSSRMTQDCTAAIVRFGFSQPADYRARDIALTSQGSHFILHTPDGRAEAELGLIGKHNIANALTAAALVGEVFGLAAQQIAAALKDAPAAPGRLQAVRCGQPFAVLVDYAHSDDALQNVLIALRPLTRGKLRLLFGCGGDRDRTKRPRMAAVAARLADAVYVTSDNPRTEPPLEILDQIVAGFPSGRAPTLVQPDRRAAIARIIADAEPGDVALLAGKGHENYQIVGTTRHHFDDVEEAMKVLAPGVKS